MFGGRALDVLAISSSRIIEPIVGSAISPQRGSRRLVENRITLPARGPLPNPKIGLFLHAERYSPQRGGFGWR
jgi:hypothetical protein